MLNLDARTLGENNTFPVNGKEPGFLQHSMCNPHVLGVQHGVCPCMRIIFLCMHVNSLYVVNNHRAMQ